jgi:hypothetical protein
MTQLHPKHDTKVQDSITIFKRKDKPFSFTIGILASRTHEWMSGLTEVGLLHQDKALVEKESLASSNMHILKVIWVPFYTMKLSRLFIPNNGHTTIVCRIQAILTVTDSPHGPRTKTDPLFAELNVDLSENTTLSHWQPTPLSEHARQYILGSCIRHVLPQSLWCAEISFLISQNNHTFLQPALLQ